tara:strand:+ start:930 stop:1313 length:384 start_codon:yes stop_codon:yes gene_type:complete
MNEYEILSLMYMGFIFNATYFVGFVLFTWLGFRMARNIYENANSAMIGKVFTTIYCIFVALFFFQSNLIGGSLLTEYTAQLVEIGSASGDRLSEYADSPTIIGGPVQAVFTLFILAFQLALVWSKKK